MGSVNEEKNAILCMKLKRQNKLGLPAIMLFLSALILFLFQIFHNIYYVIRKLLARVLEHLL